MVLHPDEGNCCRGGNGEEWCGDPWVALVVVSPHTAKLLAWRGVVRGPFQIGANGAKPEYNTGKHG